MYSPSKFRLRTSRPGAGAPTPSISLVRVAGPSRSGIGSRTRTSGVGAVAMRLSFLRSCTSTPLASRTCKCTCIICSTRDTRLRSNVSGCEACSVGPRSNTSRCSAGDSPRSLTGPLADAGRASAWSERYCSTSSGVAGFQPSRTQREYRALEVFVAVVMSLHMTRPWQSGGSFSNICASSLSRSTPMPPSHSTTSCSVGDKFTPRAAGLPPSSPSSSPAPCCPPPSSRTPCPAAAAPAELSCGAAALRSARSPASGGVVCWAPGWSAAPCCGG
mmetsp:Transcript_76273/g.204008  ORF Transcript_76273/g.204008 Transcript_76273/m.204008 type:complete len:274 (-) Transcript_76273:105-926(-)